MTTVPILLGVLAIFFLAFLLFRTAAVSRDDLPVPEAGLVEIDAGQAAGRLAKIIQAKTISSLSTVPAERVSYPPAQALAALQKTLQELYPLTHRRLRVETVGGYSLLYAWTGTEPDLKPMLILAHQDVTPVEEGTGPAWEEAPFSGAVSGGYIWGRGTLDYKNGLAGVLEAVEWLLEQGYQPARSIYLAFGHDEELGGFQGARQVAMTLQKRGIAFENILDEGGLVLDGLVPGASTPAAVVGITEKGYLSLELCAETPGGHSSLASGETSISILCRALQRIEDSPLPRHSVYFRRLVQKMAPGLPFGTRFLAANHWLFGGILESRAARRGRLDPILRTTSAATMLSAGMKDNVLPRQARAVVNFRLFPGERAADVISHVEGVIHDHRIRINPVQIGSQPESAPIKTARASKAALASPEAPMRMAVQPGEILRTGGWESPPPASPESGSFALLETTIRQIFPDAGVVPFLTPATTDSRHYAALSENIFRFTPCRLDISDLERLHGTNERISTENFATMIQFYIQWIRNNDDIR